MAEPGIDISEAAGYRVQGIKEFVDQPPMDLVITVCDKAAEKCPRFRTSDLSAITESDEKRLAFFRRIRDCAGYFVHSFSR